MKITEEQLCEMLTQILEQKTIGAETRQLLKKLVEAVNEQPLLLWEKPQITALSQAALRVLLLDIIEDEEEEISWVQKTYAFITQALLKAREEGQSAEQLFAILKNRVVLLHSHDDFFIDILDYFFFHNTPIEKETDRTDRRAFILQRIAAMQVQDLNVLETYDKELQNDTYLVEAEHKLLDKYTFTNDDLMEAQLLSDALFKYIWYQHKK